MKVVITIPAYNEEHTIAKVIHEIKDVMSKTKYKYFILVYDDGSTDKTKEVAKKNGVIVRSNMCNIGLAETFKNEMKECLKLGADIIVHTDADGQYPSEYIPQLIQKVEECNDLVLGSRFYKGKYSGTVMRKWGNILFAKVFSNLIKTKVSDTTTGFRAFNKEVAKLKIINTFTYTQEQLIRAGKNNFKIAEIYIKTRKTRVSRLFRNSIDYAIKSWINILRIERDFSPLKFFGAIGLLLFLPGFCIGLYMTYLHFTIGIQGHTALLFLMFLLLIVGLQIMVFGFLADMLKD